MEILKVGNLKKVLEENTGKTICEIKNVSCKVVGKNFVICKDETGSENTLETILESIKNEFIKEENKKDLHAFLSKNVIVNIYNDYYYVKDLKERDGRLEFVR